MKAKKIFNLSSEEDFPDAQIIGGNPSGIINFNNTAHKWALNIYRLMEANTWYPEEVSVAQDKVAYSNLSDESKYAHDMVVAQLISNDSLQTNQLVDSINQYITSPVVNTAVVLQAYQEANHSRAYALMVEEICQDSDKIYNMYKHEPALARKNQAVANMFSLINSDREPTEQDLLLAFGANQILEQLVFPGGFVVLWSLGNYLPGVAKNISFIDRDESVHTALFRNIFKAASNQVGVDTTTKETLTEMVAVMTEEEIVWTKRVSRGLLGFSDLAIRQYIHYQANRVCNNLNIPLLYEQTDGGPLMALVDKYSLNSSTPTKTNFFEAPNADYAVNALDEDF